MSFAMTREEREAFLADVHVAIISIADGERGPLAVPIWYDYEPGGEAWILTDRSSRKGKLLEAARRFSLCVQTEAPPYKCVSVEGSIVAIEDYDVEKHLRPMARRYLGERLGDRYVEQTVGDRESGGGVLVRMRPERWLTVDYSRQFQV
jgi:nitroimidazol reductase NimA-like FMN-containing flavoprotein (pyridoxamine 5'-phosphate oxidase superfamily)